MTVREIDPRDRRGRRAFIALEREWLGHEPLFVGDQGLGLVLGTISVANNVLTLNQLDVSSSLVQMFGSGQIALNDAYDANLTFQFVESKLDPYLRLLESAPRFTPYLSAIASGSLRVVGPLNDRAHLGATARIDSAIVTVVDYELRNDGDIVLTPADDTVTIGHFAFKGTDTALAPNTTNRRSVPSGMVGSSFIRKRQVPETG